MDVVVTRLRTPLRQRGARTQRWARWHDRSRAVVIKRANGKCEGCGERFTQSPEWAHLVNRGHLVAEPFCSLPELCAALCHADPRENRLGCHEQIDRNLNPALLDRLRAQAAARLAQRFGLPIRGYLEVVTNPTEPLDVIRALIRDLESLFVWDESEQALMRRDG